MPAEVHNLKMIRGIGPGVESRLHAAGIHTYQDLAAQEPETIAALLADLAGLSAARIIKQDWIGQARARMVDLATSAADETLTQLGRQHYASYTVELLLDEDNRVRRTRVVHIQSGAEEAWAAWEDERLLRFLIAQADLKLVAADQPAVANTRADEYLETTAEQPHTKNPATGAAVKPQPRGLTTLITKEISCGRLVQAGREFEVQLRLEWADAPLSEHPHYQHQVTIYAAALEGTHQRLPIGELRGALEPSGQTMLPVMCRPLGPGLYRIAATLVLSKGDQQYPSAFLDGSMLQVY
jgi:hypothetical protein